MHPLPSDTGSAPSASAMQKAIAVIHEEHQSLRYVLEKMQAFVRDTVDRRMPCDCAEIRLMLQYIRNFPDTLHHPKEDRHLFARLRLRTCDVDGVIEQLIAQHASAGAWSHRLDAALARFEGGFPPAFEDFRAVLESYCDAQRQHMQIEESVILPAAVAHLTPQDWEDIAAAFDTNGDSRFDPAAEKAMRNLYAKIMRMEDPAVAA